MLIKYSIFSEAWHALQHEFEDTECPSPLDMVKFLVARFQAKVEYARKQQDKLNDGLETLVRVHGIEKVSKMSANEVFDKLGLD